MKKSLATLLVLSIFFLVGCTNVVLEVVDAESTNQGTESQYLTAHGNFYNMENKGISKKMKDGSGSSEQTLPGAEYLNDGKHYSIVYRFSYWDSFLSVISLGWYVPFEIERKLLDTDNKPEITPAQSTRNRGE